jgi:hypothetical protein
VSAPTPTPAGFAPFRTKARAVWAVQFDGTKEDAERIVKEHGFVMRTVPGPGGSIAIEIDGADGAQQYAHVYDWIVQDEHLGYFVCPSWFNVFFEPLTP